MMKADNNEDRKDDGPQPIEGVPFGFWPLIIMFVITIVTSLARCSH